MDPISVRTNANHVLPNIRITFVKTQIANLFRSQFWQVHKFGQLRNQLINVFPLLGTLSPGKVFLLEVRPILPSFSFQTGFL